jgi:hypothetical protein
VVVRRARGRLLEDRGGAAVVSRNPGDRKVGLLRKVNYWWMRGYVDGRRWSRTASMDFHWDVLIAAGDLPDFPPGNLTVTMPDGTTRVIDGRIPEPAPGARYRRGFLAGMRDTHNIEGRSH